MKRRKPFAVFRRSVLPHLRNMSPQAWKTYSVLLLKARTAELRMTLDELAAESGMSRTATHRALRELIPYYVTKRGNGSLVIERYELDWTDEPENQISAGGKSAEHEISAGGKSAEHEISAGGKSAEHEISAGGTEISAGGKSTPYIGVREENTISPYGRDSTRASESGHRKRSAKQLPKPLTLPPSPKTAYDEFGRILLTESEFSKLVDRFGYDRTLQLCETVGSWIEQAPESKDSRSTRRRELKPYPTILNWARRDDERNPKVKTDESKPDTARRRGREAILNVARSRGAVLAGPVRVGLPKPRGDDKRGESRGLLGAVSGHSD